MPDVPLYPLPFEPFLRPMPWGGKRLAKWLDDVTFGDQPIGEAWLLSDHALHASRVASGPLAGVTLRQLMETRSVELLGRQAARFPLLIKLLDARENLSVQVHPDDASALKWAPKEGGKTEAWLTLESDPGAFIQLGLKPGVDRATVARELQMGTLPLCLQRYEPMPGECYFVPAGAIHALGGGLVILEVQQTSDATFRLYDWGRVDAQGRPRDVHHEAGLACLKERPEHVGLLAPQPLDDRAQCLVECDYFRETRRRAAAPESVTAPAILIVLEGGGSITHPHGSARLHRGQAVLLPVSLSGARLEPEGECVWVQVEAF